MPPIPPQPIKVAVLDDYQGLAASHFMSLEPTFHTTIFRDTLVPYNHPEATPADQVALVARLAPFKIICSMRERTPFPKELLNKLPHLKLLLTTGLRNASIDTQAASKLGIRITGARGVGRSDKRKEQKAGKGRAGPDSTTQHCVALILGVARNLASDDWTVKNGGWQTGLATGLPGRVLGVVGLGRLGINVAKIMVQAFGMRVVAWSSSLTQETADEQAKAVGLQVEDENGAKTFKVVEKEELFRIADVVSVHYVLSDRSRGIIGEKELALMKSSALFVNTSRGPLVDESALLDMLRTGKIKGAALDVFDLEPLAHDSAWRSMKWGTEGRSHVLLSPHMGYVEAETLNNWYEEQVENIERWREGKELLDVLI